MVIKASMFWIHLWRIKILVEIWKKFKHRLPLKMYQEHMLQIADFLFGIKVFDKVSPNIWFAQLTFYFIKWKSSQCFTVLSVTIVRLIKGNHSVLIAVHSLLYYLPLCCLQDSSVLIPVSATFVLLLQNYKKQSEEVVSSWHTFTVLILFLLLLVAVPARSMARLQSPPVTV